MKNGEIPQRHETRYGAMLDEMLGIRSKKGNVTQEGCCFQSEYFFIIINDKFVIEF